MPQRGDVAVFRQPTDPAVSFIKRVVGLPGDRIQVKSGLLHINDVTVNRKYLGLSTATNGFLRVNFKVYEETLPNGAKYLIQERFDDDSYDNTAIFQLPDGHYFMMGDNRDNSRDSRTTAVGMVPAENLVGRADRLFLATMEKLVFGNFGNGRLQFAMVALEIASFNDCGPASNARKEHWLTASPIVAFCNRHCAIPATLAQKEL